MSRGVVETILAVSGQLLVFPPEITRLREVFCGHRWCRCFVKFCGGCGSGSRYKKN